MLATNSHNHLHDQVLDILSWADDNKNNQPLIQQILEKSAQKQGLSPREASLLLVANTTDIYPLARKIKQEIYGRRVVLFAPLYLSNHCINGCTYCAYQANNHTMPRKKLTQDQIAQEVIALQNMGHKRLAIEAGEHAESNIDYILESIHTIYNVKNPQIPNGQIRRINVNIAATTVEEYQQLAAANIGTYVLFQETYHPEAYGKYHLQGPKADYLWHLTAIDRALTAGLQDVGIGALLGLEDYRYEFTATLLHAQHLEDTYNIGPHTISVPRIRKADGVASTFPHAISDDVFKRYVACLRIAVPYTGIIVSTRESAACRAEVLDIGVSQISGGSSTSVGGYTAGQDTNQFSTTDKRPLQDIVQNLLETGHLPSFCTACYKEGRVGEVFMNLSKSGKIHSCCNQNALTTLQEYLDNYGTPALQAIAQAQKEIFDATK